MAIKTQGTKLYVVDPDDDSLITVACVLNISGVDTTNEQIETTCLEDAARTYVAGLSTPGQGSFGLNYDSDQSSHTRLHQLKVAKTILNWVIGLSDGTTLPVVDSGGTWDLATTRTWIRFQGFITNYPFEIAQNSVVQSTLNVQITGEPELKAKA